MSERVIGGIQIPFIILNIIWNFTLSSTWQDHACWFWGQGKPWDL